MKLIADPEMELVGCFEYHKPYELNFSTDAMFLSDMRKVQILWHADFLGLTIAKKKHDSQRLIEEIM